MKKRKVINIVLVICIAIGVFLVIRFGLVSRIENIVYEQKIKNENLNKDDEMHNDGPELVTEKLLDKDGNEVVIEMRKIVVKDEETGEEVIMYEDTAEHKIIYDYMYQGTVEKIDGNKIYFTIDKESENGSYFCEDVKDHMIIFNLDSYDTEADTGVGYFVCDHLILDYDDFYSIKDLEKLVGKYIRVQKSKYEDYYTGEEYKVLNFFTE
jgi:hypothetical protein